jgi:hypothetical protein
MLPHRAIQAIGQNPCGMTKFSTVNSWSSRNTSHGPVGAISVTGLVWNTSDGFVRFRTVILIFTVPVIGAALLCLDLFNWWLGLLYFVGNRKLRCEWILLGCTVATTSLQRFPQSDSELQSLA